MGRWTQYDEDDYRLPEGFRLVGYDADVQMYFFKDHEGTLWSSKERHGVMQPVQKKRREKAKEASMDEAAVDSDDEATLVYISDEELDDAEVSPSQPRSLWTLYDNGQVPRVDVSNATSPKSTQPNAASFSFLPSSSISPAEPIGESSSSGGATSPLRKHGFRNIARLVQSSSTFITDKVKNNVPTSVADPDGSGWRQDEKSGAHTLAQADREWEDIKRSSTTGSRRTSGFSGSPSNASTATRVSTTEKEKGKKSLEVPDSDSTPAKRAFSLRNPKGREEDRDRTRPGLAHTKSVSSGHTVPTRMTEKKQHEKKPSFPPAGWSTTPDPPRQKDALRAPTSAVKAVDTGSGEAKKRLDDKSLPVPINKSLPSSPHATPTRNTTSNSPAIPSVVTPARNNFSSTSIPQTRPGALNSSSSNATPPSPPGNKGKQKAVEDGPDPRLDSLPSVPTAKLESLSLGSGQEKGRSPGSAVKEGVLVDIS